MNNFGVLFFAFILFVSCSNDTPSSNQLIEEVYSSDKAGIKAYNLIGPLEAAALLSEYPDVYLPVQVSTDQAFKKEHIPGASNIWRPDYGSDSNVPYGGLIPTYEKLQNLLRQLGFQNGQSLLLYDAKSNVDALRLAWILELYGFQNFKIINGGLKYWKLQGLAVTDDIEQQSIISKYQLRNSFDTSIFADFEDVISAIGDSNTIIVDTREDYEYKGIPHIYKTKIVPYKDGAFNRGSIPGSVHLNWSTLSDLNGDHRIKSEKDLRYDLEKRGIRAEKQILLYCHSGSRTSHTFYVLKHVLGYEKVKNYDGSWIEWSFKNSLDAGVPIQQLYSDTDCEKIKDSLISSLLLK